MRTELLTNLLPKKMREQARRFMDAIDLGRELSDPRVLVSLLPSGIRGIVLQQGREGQSEALVKHPSRFDWTYPADHPEMRALYTRAKKAQWNPDTELDWSTSVDPHNPERPLLPETFLDFDDLATCGARLDERERTRLLHSVCGWMLSQFLHGEQGALFAAAQVTQAVPFFDGKLYGATQVVDEGRHVEVFHRYLSEKLENLYQVNDNLFVIIDALMRDSRWDMKFLGMQIMIEGLALGAFGTLYRQTREPLLKNLLRLIIQDEARHVHYGVIALKEHFSKLSDRERREREEWAFEIALLMRNRFLVDEVYDEWFSGTMTRKTWREFVTRTPGMRAFRTTMFSRLVPNLRELGLIPPRMLARYEAAGLLVYMQGRSATTIDGPQMLTELDAPAHG